jgi:hypothetical protein
MGEGVSTMMSQSEFENLASVAKDRHAEILAQVQQQQLLNQVTPDRPPRHSVWHWLQEVIVDRVRHAVPLGSPGTHHSIQHH